MKLHALEMEQFRKFTYPMRLSGFGDRVNLLCGPNEFGKSTVLAAIRGLLFERHNSKAGPIKQMQNWQGDAAPRLAMEFETGGGLWRIEKRFLHQPMARLTAPDGGRFDGDAAEETLQRVLGFGASGKTGAKPGQMGVWGALWVTQRDSVLQADLSSEIARATITNCLDAEVGVMTGNEKGQALIRAARDQLGALLDGRGQPRGRYKQVADGLELLAAELAALRDRAERLASDTAALRQQQRLLQRESDPAAELRDAEELASANGRLVAALLHEQQMAAARSKLSLAERDHGEARAEQAARMLRAKELAAAEAAIAAHLAAGAGRDAAIAVARDAVAQGRVVMDAAQARVTRAAAQSRHLRRLADLARRASALTGLVMSLAAAEAMQIEVNERAARLGQNPVTAERVEAVRKAARELDSVRAIRDAQATQVEFDLAPGRAAEVAVEGQMLAGDRATISVVEETELTLAGWGRIRIRPVIRDVAKLRTRLTAADTALVRALAAAACADAAAAELQFTERQSLERSLGEARADLARLTPGDAAHAVPPGLGPLREYVDTLRRLIVAEQDGLGLTTLPETAEITAQLRAAEIEEGDAAEEAAGSRTALEAAMERFNALQLEAGRLEGQITAAQTAHGLLASAAGAAHAREPDDALADRAAHAETAAAALRQDLAALERAQPIDAPEAMRARVERYEQAIVNRRNAVRGLRETIIGLRTRIEAEGGNGLDEIIAAKTRESEMLVAEHAALAGEARVLRLLLDTLAAAERETKEQYLAPIIRRVTPYLAGLFPGVTVSCDDSLRVIGLTRDGNRAEAFERLSDGTQEQIAVLARLAFSEMLKDQKKPAMVILDDALAYSDAERLERMFDIITQASMKMQILVLTCRDDLFARLGGNRLELRPVAA